MKKLFYILISFMMLMSTNLKADEGMWLPLFVERLNYVDMKEMGLQLTPEEIYSINNSSMKDAIVGLELERRLVELCARVVMDLEHVDC